MKHLMIFTFRGMGLARRANWWTVIMGVSGLLALQLICIRTAKAQATAGTVLGTVTDTSGAVIPNASVVVSNTDTGIARKVETDPSGNYEVPNLLPGRYSIRVEKQGFQTAVVSDLTLQVNQSARYNIQMKVGQVTQQVNVTATGLTKLETTGGSLGQVVDQQYVDNLPLNGRNYTQLLTIGAGTIPVTNNNPAASPVAGDTGRTGLSYSVSGQQITEISYLIDGVESKFNFDMVAAFQPSIDFIQEFKVQSNSSSAQFGGAPAIINVATKSGTNQLHGSAFEFIRNSALDATQIQDPIVDGKRKIAPFRQNQFGASIGGPVWLPHIYNGKNRTFWFFDYEGLRSYRFQEFQGWEPTSAMLNGDFSGLKDANGNVIPIYDPATYDPATGLRQPFSGNIIPSNRFSTLAKNMKALVPPATIQSGNISQFNTFQGRNETNLADQYNVRIDHKISDSMSIFGRYSTYDNPLIEPLGFGDTSTENLPINDTNSVVGFTYIINPTTINELHLGYNKEHFLTIPYNPSGANVSEQLGIKNLNPNPYQYGAPSVGGTNFSGFGPDGFDVTSGGQLFQYHDVLTMIRGKHTIRVGGDVYDQRPWFLDEDASKRGTFSFTGDFTSQLSGGGVSVAGTGSDFADFLLGFPQGSSGQTGSTYTKFHRTSSAYYALDEVKLKPSLTVNLGLRYDYNMHYIPYDNNIEGFCTTCVQYGQPGMLVQTILGQVRSQVVDPDWRQFAPRLGVAWRPWGVSNTVLRSGFGIYYSPTKGDEVNMMEFPTNKTAVDVIDNQNPIPSFNMDQAFPVLPPAQNLSPFVTDLRDKWPQVMEWNLDLQHTFARNWMLDVAYVGSHARNVSMRWNINQAHLDANPLQPTPIESRRPFPLYGNLLDSAHPPFAIMNYDGLQTSLKKTFSNGYTLIAGYTYGRCLNIYNADSSDVNNQNAFDPQADYGLCGYNVKNRFDVSGIWMIPSGLKGVGGALTKGWQLNYILTFQGGTPLHGPYMPGDWANVGGRYHTRLNRVCDGNLSNPSVAEWFDTSCFAPPERGTFGNAGRAVVIGPRYHDLDASLFRSFSVTEKAKLQFRWEVFNALNNGNYDAPGTTYGRASYARITSEEPKREMQFSLKVLF